MKLVNVSGRARVLSRPIEMLRLNPGDEIEVTQAELEDLRRHPNIRNWLHKGYLEVQGGDAKPLPTAVDERPGPEIPEGATGEGTEIIEHAAGWYSVFHEGMPCTDKKVRYEQALEIAAEYE